MERVTWLARQLALVYMMRYRQAKVTGSCISVVMATSSLSTSAIWASLMLPTPRSPATENLMPSLVQETTTTLSTNWLRSLTILWNSLILMMQA